MSASTYETGTLTAPAAVRAPVGAHRAAGRRRVGRWLMVVGAPVVAVHVLATVLRFWALGRVGFNSDEAVYAGTAAALAGDPTLSTMFPVFRAHPVLFQMLVSLAFHSGVSDVAARAVAAGLGVLAVTVTYALGARLYGHLAGAIGALLLAVMPYHVTVSRQVLLDGLMTLCATLVLYCLVRYAETITFRWLLAAGAMMGITTLAKETSLVLLGGTYAFFALTPVVRLRARHLLGAVLAMGAIVLVVPVVLAASGRTSTSQNYLLWQLFRRPNHSLLFYLTVIPPAVGWAVVVAVVTGALWLRRENTWRERLLFSWVAVPVLFFTLWPVKGYQYLLPVAPVLAVLGGRVLARIGQLPALHDRWPHRTIATALVLGVAASLAIPAWRQLDAPTDGTFLAGTGGLPGGRESGRWVAMNVPAGAQLLAIGPSMANVLQFYGGRRVFALSVSPNPVERNPSYVPVPNPDRALRDGEFQYVVWDSYTAQRAPFFAEKARSLIDKFHGIAVFTATVPVRAASHVSIVEPVVIIYRVRPV